MSGHCKAGSYEAGDSIDDSGTNWNIVKINRKWEIVHPDWICTAVVGMEHGGYVQLESGGEAVMEATTENEGVTIRMFDDKYFMTRPSHFARECLAFVDFQQLLKNPISKEQFEKQAYFRQSFFTHGMSLTSEDSCCLRSEEGQVVINFKSDPKTANSIEMWYSFYMKTKDDNAIQLDAETLPRLVAMIRSADKWTFKIQFPLEGTYKLGISGGFFGNDMEEFSEFRIECDARKDECKPLPIDPGKTGFGPGPQADLAGLHLPSHRNGIYSFDQRQPVAMRFIVLEEMVITTSVKTMRKENGVYNSIEVKNCVKVLMHKERQEVNIVSKIKEKGEFALTISTAPPDDPDNTNIACNYLLTTELKKLFEVIYLS